MDGCGSKDGKQMTKSACHTQSPLAFHNFSKTSNIFYNDTSMRSEETED